MNEAVIPWGPGVPETWGTNTALLGPPGAGKTTALVTAIKAGLELAVVVTDPGGSESLIDAMKRQNLPMNRLHTKYVGPAVASWDALKKMAQQINMMSYKDLSEMKSGIDKSSNTRFLDLLDTLSNFKSDRGAVLGPVDSWGPDRMLALDSATGLNMMAMGMMVGLKPAPHQGEWGVAMNAEEQLILKLCADTKCFFCMTFHLDREFDELRGKTMQMAGLLGKKLAPKVPRTFSDIILAYREGASFFWSTVHTDVDLKSRALPLREKLDPDFAQIIEVWKRRNQQQVQTSTQPGA